MRNYFLVPGVIIFWAGLRMVSFVGPAYTNVAASGVMLLAVWLSLYRWRTLPAPWGPTRKRVFQFGVVALTAAGVNLHFTIGQRGTAIGLVIAILVIYWIAQEVRQRTSWGDFPRFE